MKNIFLVVIFLTVYNSTSYAQLENIPLITVTGESVITVLPDYAIVTVPVQRPLAKNDVSMILGSTIFQRENNLIRLIGLNDTSITSSIEQIIFTEGNTIFIKEFVLKVGIKNLTDVYVELIRRGFKEFDVSYRVSNIVSLKNQAFKQAMTNAKSKASTLAYQSGQRIGKTHSIAEQPVEINNWYERTLLVRNGDMINESYLLNPGFITIPGKLIVSYDLEK